MVMHVELQATCSALGYQEGDQYVREPDCLETIKDLIRFLKREDDTCDIRRQLGEAQILQKDLLQILKHYKEETTLFETVLRLLVNLTQPTILCFGNKLPSDKLMRNHALEIDGHLQAYKEAFVDEELFAVLAEKVGNILKLDWESRQEEDKLLLERLLILIRNILHIPPNPDLEQRTDDDASLHDQVLWVIHVSGLEDMILYIASSENERHLCLHLLEIVSLMFREQTAETLACAGVQRSLSEKEKDERELQMIREKERVMKKMAMLKHSTRHSRFGGTYVVANMKSISDRDLIYHKSQAEVQNFSLDNNKRPKKKPKNRQPIKDKEISRRSTLSIRLSLKEFCIQFLENAYNPLMYAVKDSLTRERTQEHDETYYMWALRFFMEFCRNHSKRVELVSETLSVPTFHYIYTNLVTYYEMIMTEKTEAITWSKRVHLALKAYQELLMTVDMMDRSKNPQLMESSKVIKSNVFYMMEYRDIFVTLLKKFDQSKQSRTYLRDLVETTHLFVKMLEHFCKRSSHLVVQKKKKKKKKKAKPKAPVAASEPSEQELEDLWDEISGTLSGIFQGREDIPQVAPFDAASEVEVDQQRVDAMCRIQDSMRSRAPGEAVAIFRAAREVWPERDEFGTQDMAPEDEFMALREIFMAPLPKRNVRGSQSQEGDPEEGALGEAAGEIQDEEEDEEEESAVSEQEFDLKGFLLSFCKPDVLKPYGLLLADFEKNTDHTNHCIVKMLHRVSVDLYFPGMIFQASIFRVFQKVLLGPYAKLSRFKELMKFATFVVRKFVEVAEHNKKVFMEMLFWKGSREAQEISEGYGTVSSSKGRAQWSEELEQELERLWEEFRDNQDPGQDIADLILSRLTDPSKTRLHVIQQLKKQGYIQSAKELKKPKKRPQKFWTEEEEAELTDLFNQFKDAKDTVMKIVGSLSVKRSKYKVTDKLLSMGLVQHRSQLYVRRRKKNLEGEEREDGGRFSDGSIDDNLPGFVTTESESDSEEPKTDETTDSEQMSVGERLRCLVDKGYRDQIAWIQRGLCRSAEDRERDAHHVAVPIVPLSEENETAMEDQMFLDFLQIIGVSPPANEQEAFWRIPAELSAPELRNIVEGLELDEGGNPVAADKIKPVERKIEKKMRKTKKAPSSTNLDRNEEKRKKDEEKRQKQKEEKQKSKERRNALKALAKQRKGPGKRKRKDSNDHLDSEEGSNSEEENVAMETSEPPVNGEESETSSVSRETTQPKKKSRMKKIVDSDSDSDNDRLRIAEDSESGTDAHKPPSKRPKLFDSDSEQESQPNSQVSRHEQKNKLFDSDSDSSGDEQGSDKGRTEPVSDEEGAPGDRTALSQSSVASSQQSLSQSQSVNSSQGSVASKASRASQDSVAESQDSVSASQNSLAASQDSVAASQNSVASSQNSVAASQDSVAASQNSVASSQDSVAASQNSVASSQDSLAASQDSVASSHASVANQSSISASQNSLGSTRDSVADPMSSQKSVADSDDDDAASVSSSIVNHGKKSRAIMSDSESDVESVDTTLDVLSSSKKGKKKTKILSDSDDSSVMSQTPKRKKVTESARKKQMAESTKKNVTESARKKKINEIESEKKETPNPRKNKKALQPTDSDAEAPASAKKTPRGKKAKQEDSKKKGREAAKAMKEAETKENKSAKKKSATSKKKKMESDSEDEALKPSSKPNTMEESSSSEDEPIAKTLASKAKRQRQESSREDETLSSVKTKKPNDTKERGKKSAASKKKVESDSEDEALKPSSKPNAVAESSSSEEEPIAKTLASKGKRHPQESSSEDEVLSSVKSKKPKAEKEKENKSAKKKSAASKKKNVESDSEDEALKPSSIANAVAESSSSEEEPIAKTLASKAKRQPQESSREDETLSSVKTKKPKAKKKTDTKEKEIKSAKKKSATSKKKNVESDSEDEAPKPTSKPNTMEESSSSEDEPIAKTLASKAKRQRQESSSKNEALSSVKTKKTNDTKERGNKSAKKQSATSKKKNVESDSEDEALKPSSKPNAVAESSSSEDEPIAKTLASKAKRQRQEASRDEETLSTVKTKNLKAKKEKQTKEKENKPAQRKSVASKKRKKVESDSEDEPLKPSSKPNTMAESSSSEDEPIAKTLASKAKRQRQESSSDNEALSSVKTKKPKAKRARVVESDTEMSPLKLSMSESPDAMSPLHLSVTQSHNKMSHDTMSPLKMSMSQDVVSTQDVTQDTSKLFNSEESSSEDEPLLNTVKAKMAKTNNSFPATLLTQPLGESDSDVDDHVPLRKVIRKKVIDSDGE